MSLTWTSDPPMVPGWYWVMPKCQLWGKQPLQFFIYQGSVFSPDLTWSNVGDYLFSGPIPEPQEPQKEGK